MKGLVQKVMKIFGTSMILITDRSESDEMVLQEEQRERIWLIHHKEMDSWNSGTLIGKYLFEVLYFLPLALQTKKRFQT